MILDQVHIGVFSAYVCLSKLDIVYTYRFLGCIWLCNFSKGGQLFKFMDKFRYLETEDLLQGLLIKNSSAEVEFLENKTEEIRGGV